MKKRKKIKKRKTKKTKSLIASKKKFSLNKKTPKRVSKIAGKKKASKKMISKSPPPFKVKKKIKKNKVIKGVFYGLNPKFIFLNELKNLILASPVASFEKLAKRISSLGKIKLALVSGVFLNKENVADILIVGDSIDKRRFKNFLKSLEAEVGTQLNYAIMDKEEFDYRRAMFDRFVRMFLEGPHQVLIDKIGL